jgi:drug/metabolite transporter (DMT)-like permease
MSSTVLRGPVLRGQRNDAPRGIAWMVGGSLFIALQVTLVKYLAVDGYAALQLLWVRYLVQMALVFLLALRTDPRAMFVSRRPLLQLARSSCALLSAAAGFAGFALLPLTLVTVIHFAAPFIVAALSVLLLRESISPQRWLAIAVGFAGVLIVVRPGSADWQIELLLPIAGAIFFAIFQMLTRAVAAHDSVATSVFYAPAVGAVVLAAAMPFLWVAPDTAGIALMVALGVFGAIGQSALTKATQAAAASVVAPFQYTQLFWVGAAGFLIFDTLPDQWTLVGAAVIVASGLYMFRSGRTPG